MVVSQADLRRILFGRVLVRRRPIDALSGHDVHLHSVRHHVVNARRDQVFDLRGVLRSDNISGLYSGPGGDGEQTDTQYERADTRDFPCDAGTTTKHSRETSWRLRKGRPDGITRITASQKFREDKYK